MELVHGIIAIRAHLPSVRVQSGSIPCVLKYMCNPDHLKYLCNPVIGSTVSIVLTGVLEVIPINICT